jgi:hypothetical protein
LLDPAHAEFCRIGEEAGMSAPRYEILTVQDFANVPEDRREICLREFAVWLGLVVGVKKLMRGVPLKLPEAFVWVDDDKHEATIGISAGGEHIHIASGVMRGFGL